MTSVAKKKRANMRDVAKASSVSVATVSRVWNKSPLVSDETRGTVIAAIESLKFVPSAAARAINSGRTRMVGALVPTLDNAIFSLFIDALEEELGKFGLSLVVAATRGDEDVEVFQAQRLLDIGVEGLVVSGITHGAEFYSLVERSSLPVVATSYYDPDFRLPTIGYDNAGIAQLSLKHLIDLGHRRIAVLHGPTHNNDRTRARIRGLEKRADAILSFYETEIQIASAGDAAEAAINATASPSALLCLADVLAHGALFRCQNLGVAVPKDISIVGLDDLPASASTCPPLTSVHSPVKRMGRKTASSLAKWVEEGVRPAPELINAHLVIRSSAALRQSRS
jgi:LacI family transcriptional regulator